MTLRLPLAILGAAAAIYGQTQVDLSTQAKKVDFSAASSTRPVRVGSALPATCSQGELFFVDSATAGKNLYGCTAANTWTVMSGAAVASGCGLTGCESGTCQIDSGVIPSYTGTLNTHGVIVARDGATIGSIAPGTAGYVLTSNGADADPSWSPSSATANHAALSNLDYANSGHTGFQAELGYTPERALTFVSPLVRSGDSISCPTCGSSSGGTATPAGETNAVQYNTGSALGGVTVNSTGTRKFLMQVSGGTPAFDVLGTADLPKRITPMYTAMTAAKCQAGVALANFNLPSSNAPTAVCQSGTTYGAVLQFAAAATQSFMEHVQLPADWSNSPNTIDLELAGRSADSTHPVSVSVSYACVGTGAGIDSLTFSSAGTASFTPGASSSRTLTTISNLTATGCNVNDDYYFVVAITTSASATAPYELISLRSVIRRAF